MAVHVVGVRRALGLLLAELAEVIDHEDGYFANYDFEAWQLLSEMRVLKKKPLDDWIRTVHFELQVPRVLRLLAFDRVPRASFHPSRQAIFARDLHRCQYCGHRFPVSKLSLDHVVPRRSGGENTWENMVCACRKCNVKKGGRTPREAHMQLARNPVRPTTSPLLMMKLDNPKYASWAMWLGRTIAPVTEIDHTPEDESAAALRSA
jgi:5-methylcytosine-specific restriction endonuclease McrA